MRLNERGVYNMSNDTNYKRKAITTQIRATSRASIKVSESFYTVEYSEDRTIPDIDGVDIEEEKRILWDDVNAEVDNQIEDILRTFKK